MHKVFYSPQARRDLKKLELRLAQRIVKKIQFFSAQNEPLSFAKALKMKESYYRFRIGDYRAIFSMDGDGALKILNILRVKHRKDIYDL